MLHLPSVTLVAVSSVDIEATDLALRISSSGIQFGAIKFLCSEDWASADSKIQIVPIPKIDFEGYSKFILQELVRYIDTDYCLIIQADGFVLNPSRWMSEFLEYDYIGAPWPETLKLNVPPHLKYLIHESQLTIDVRANLVGNGGFSLRSKRLLAETVKINFDELRYLLKSEDLIICHYFYEKMKSAGMRFPRPELAAKFSIESPTAAYGQNPKTSFGFHGKSLRDLIFSNILLT